MDQLDSTENNLEVSNPPDVTKPEPSFHRNYKGNNDSSYKSSVISFKQKSSNHDTTSLKSNGNQSLVSALLDAKSASTSGYESKSSVTLDPRLSIFDQSHKKSFIQNSKTLHGYKMSSKGYNKPIWDFQGTMNEKGKVRIVKGRSRSSDSRVSSGHSLGGSSEEKHLTASGSESDDRTLSSRASRILSQSTKSKSKSQKNKLECSELEEIKPPLPPRTDKMPKDFKPPIPPKLHKMPAGRNSLKERLKNNLKLELRLPASQGSAYKRAKFKVKLIQRAQLLRSTNGKNKNKRGKNTNNNSTENVVLLKYRKLEPSLSMPYNLGANTPGSNSLGGGDQLMRHSQSTLSMPSFLWDVANASSPAIAESMPDLLASDSESSSESKRLPPPPPPRSRSSISERKRPILSNVEVGLVSASDPTLIEVGYLKKQIDALNRATKKLGSPVKWNADSAKSQLSQISLQDSSSNSDITSERSGWVSNSSRHTSISTSPGQCSPAVATKPFQINDRFSIANTHYKSNGGTPVTVLTTLSDPPPTKSSTLGKHKSRPIAQSPASNHRVSKSDSKVHGHNNKTASKEVTYRTPSKEVTHRSASNDQLQANLKKSPSRKEVKKSQSLHKVSNSNRPNPHIYEEVPIPPPPKEFQDPMPGIKESIRGGGFATTGRLPREERSARKPIPIFKDRPRSESPKAEANRIANGNGHKSDRVITTSYGTELELDDVLIYESVSEVISEARKNSHKKEKTNYEKFNSLPSMRRKTLPLSTMTQKRPEKRNKERKHVTPVDRFSEPTPTKVNPHLQTNGSGNERSRTQSAPPEGIDKIEDEREHHHHRREGRSSRRSEPIPIQPEPMTTHLADSKFTLLELFLEQQGASAWAHREAQRELLKEAQRAQLDKSVLEPRLTRKTVKLAEAGKSKSVRGEESKKTEKLAAKMNSVDVLDDAIAVSDIPPPPRPPSPRWVKCK